MVFFRIGQLKKTTPNRLLAHFLCRWRQFHRAGGTWRTNLSLISAAGRSEAKRERAVGWLFRHGSVHSSMSFVLALPVLAQQNGGCPAIF
jgi:hypothetical protein